MLIPIKTKVLIKMQEGQEVTKSGIILTANKENKPILAKVVAIGKEVTQVKINDDVIVSRYIGNKIKYNNEEYIVLEEKEILARLER